MEATINLFEQIPLILSVTDKDGNPIPSAVLSNVVFTLDAKIGDISPDPNKAGQWLFKPTQAGTTHIIATAEISVP